MHLSCLSNSKKITEPRFQLIKYQYDTIIITPEESQYGSIKCELRRNYKNGIYLIFVYADHTAARDGVIDLMSLDQQCPIHLKSQWKAHPQVRGRYIYKFNIITKFRLIPRKYYFMFWKDWDPIMVSAVKPMTFFRDLIQEI